MFGILAILSSFLASTIGLIEHSRWVLEQQKGFCGEGEIRTPGELAPTAVFKTAALNRYATSPRKFIVLDLGSWINASVALQFPYCIIIALTYCRDRIINERRNTMLRKIQKNSILYHFIAVLTTKI